MRLGFPVRVYGCADLPSHDGRPAHQSPSLSLSLAYLRDVLYYLHANRIGMYRMHAELLPAGLQQDWGAAQREIAACAAELALVGQLAAEWDMRLSVHAGLAVALSAPEERQAEQSAVSLQALAALMDDMALGAEARIVVHLGGVYEGAAPARERFARRYVALPEGVRRRLALENDDRRFGLDDALAVHAAVGIPVVLDVQHHLVLDPQRIPMRSALERALATWPPAVTPKVHFTTPCAEMRSAQSARLKAPTWTEHADYINPFEFAAFCALGEGLRPFDVMLEAKARDLALLKLRRDLARYAPEVAAAVR